MTPVRRAALAGVALLAFSSEALGAPTLWQRAHRPRAKAEAELTATLERMLDNAARDDMIELGLDRGIAHQAVAMIVLKGLTEPSDPYLCYLEARVLVKADIGREAEARRLLESALREFPPGSRAASAWSLLAPVLGMLGEPKAEHDAYSRVLELTWNPELRALAYYNRGDTSMLLRNLEEARSDYQKAVEEARELSLIALARYGLAVAEERLGDLPAAYAVLDKALVTLPVPAYAAEDPLDLPDTLFVPAYEENYIRALRAMAIARRATDPSERYDAFEIAVVEWDTYLARSPDDEPFRENARANRARAERERDRRAPRTSH